jgi:hypothetical protein
MAGSTEGNHPRGDAKSQQPSQPEHTQPLQGRAAGRESLQGPTTVDRSEQPKSDAERLYGKRLEEIRTIYEKDPNLFATRAIEALGELLEATIPDARRAEESEQQGVNAQLRVLRKATTEEKRMEQKLKLDLILYSRLRSEGYKHGLEDAFKVFYERIAGESTLR